MQEFKALFTEEEYARGVLSRRRWLKAAGIGVAGGAVAGLAAGTPAALGNQSGGGAAPPAKSAKSSNAQSTNPNDSFVTGWLGQAPGLKAADAAETVECDFLVIGAGVAGMAAALSARLENPALKVIVIEKAPSYSARGLVFGAVDSQFQKKLGIDFDRDRIFLDWMQYSGNRANPLLVRKWIDESGPAYDWFARVTTEVKPFTPRVEHWPRPEKWNIDREYYRQYNTGIEYTGPDGADLWASQGGVINEFYDKSVREGVTYLFNTEALELFKAADGQTGGAFARRAGRIIQYQARKGTLLATGDYGANAEMLKALCPEFYLALKCQPTRIRTSTGDGHRMAIWAGAQMEPGPHAHMSHAFAGGAFGLGATAALQLNLHGRRWGNEDVPGQSFTNALLRQPRAISYQIWDDGHTDAMLYNQNIGHGNTEMQLQSAAKLAALHVRWAESLAPGYKGFMWGGRTLEELFQKVGLPVDAAVAAVRRYNELAAKGHDDDFRKRADRLYPVSQGPFYASMAFVAAGVMTAGIMVDGDCRVIDGAGAPLGRLWAAGNVMGGRYAIDYPTMCPATSHGTAITFGKSIGRQVARAPQ